MTTSYKRDGFEDIITGLVKMYKPKVVVELGTQQGASAILIAKALNGGHVYTYDLFEPKYDKPPYAETHADYEQTLINIKNAGLENVITVRKKNAFLAFEDFKQRTDMLHVDLCNYFDNVWEVIRKWYDNVDVILLEGGYHNRWQKEKGFKPYTEILTSPLIENRFYVATIGDDEYALTVLANKFKHDTLV